MRASVEGANMLVTRNVAKDPAQTKLIADYKQGSSRPIASKVIGHITPTSRAPATPAGESALGDLIADAQLDDPSVVAAGSRRRSSRS